MRIGILETGYPPAHLVDEHGTYPDMLQRFVGDGASYEVFDVQKLEFPAPGAFEALLITGSPAGVYDDFPWIPRLVDFLRRTKGNTPMVGVCFGHQVMAEAFGGHVRKSEKGWGIGLHRYRVLSAEPWMGDVPDEIAIPVSHQDQVVELPPHAHVVAANAFTPFAVLAYEDQPAVSFQCHPEFSTAYAKAIAERRRGQVPDAQIEQAVASLDGPHDKARLGDWVRGFLSGSRRQAA